MNGAYRFFTASRAGDIDGAVAQLADDVVMLNPAVDDPIVGREAVAAALRAVEQAADEFHHTHLLAGTGEDGAELFGLVFEARVGDGTLEGVDLVELDDAGLIRRFRVASRPLGPLMELGGRMAAGPPAAG